MKHLTTIALAAMSVISGIAAYFLQHDHFRTAIAFYVACAVCAALAIQFAFLASIPRPRIRFDGFGQLSSGHWAGLLFRNDGEPAYVLSVPEPVEAGSKTIEFSDPVLTELRKEQGTQCFEAWVRDSFTASGRTTLNSVREKLILAGYTSFISRFHYADGSRPKLRRYTVTFRLFPTSQGWRVELLSDKPNYWLLWFPLFGKESTLSG